MMKNFSTSSFVAGCMLGALLVGAWYGGNNFTPALLSSPSPSLRTPVQTSFESGAVSVADQSAGAVVTVESVTVPPPGVWVAVREVSGDDLGNILGAVHVSGPRTMLTVPLLRETIPGLSYAVELYRDNGDGEFDLVTDSVYIDFTTSAPVIERFTTTK